ncbi:hypothetical protein HN371_12365 [Candidatus Poribacteria bacterium]|nr:hypothetical protein [Candidatus Poribacteria bacterium]
MSSADPQAERRDTRPPHVTVLYGAGSPGDARYVEEILTHAGVFYEAPDADHGPGELRSIVVVCGGALGERARDTVARHVVSGGGLLCIGSTGGLDGLLGVSAVEQCGPGWIEACNDTHPAAVHASPLHVFGGVTVAADSADELATLHGRAAVTWRRHADGHAMLIGPDICGAVAHIQQADTVVGDGEPAPDGTAPLDDGILKAEDGVVLDWERDRHTVHVPRGLFPGAWGGGAAPPHAVGPADEPHPFPIFRDPVADGLREVLLRALLSLASAASVPLTMLWYWPRGLPAVGHISHDSDGNDPELGAELQRVCLDAGARTTWCMLYPGGYPPSLYRQVRDDGSEVALHYDALEGAGVRAWGRSNFAAQARWLRDMTGHDSIISNKNHYTRWEGRVEFFDWCVDEGIRVDQSKGPSKTGTIGFPFGSCHLWKPLDTDGAAPRFIDAYCLPLMTQDLVITAPAAFAQVLTDAARDRYGVAHFLYHPAHIAKEGVAESFHDLVNYARDCGMEWWTSAELAEWEDARRGVEVRHGELAAPATLSDATVLRLLPNDAEREDRRPVVERYGFRFEQTVGSLAPS